MDLFNIGNERASLFLMPLVQCCRSSVGKGAVSGAPPPGGNDSRAERAQLVWCVQVPPGLGP